MYIKVKPFEMISVLTYEGLQQINEHGYVKISGRIQRSQREANIHKAETETWVQVVVSDGQETEETLFYGILTGLSIQPDIEGDIMELFLHTGSKKMDYVRHKRSFQRPGYSYKEIAECCIDGYRQAGMIMMEGKGCLVDGFTMQYEETDWEFLKRLASRLHTVLVPSCKVPGEKFFWGIADKKGKGKLDTENYVICQKNEKDIFLINEGYSRQTDNFYYLVESMETFELGDCIQFQGSLQCIWRIETILKGNELWHTYYLKKKEAILVPQIYQKEIIGLSLLGRIKGVRDEQVQVALDDDENKDSGVNWFPFSTVYSSPDGAGWYCMPEPGDAVHLYFPTEDEADAYVTSAYQEDRGRGVRINPECKIWRNREGKEIRLTSDKVLITNNRGMSIELFDQQGIRIQSNASITVDADNDINIQSSCAGLELAASGKIELRQGDTKMELSDGIRLSGATVKMQ